MSNLQHLINYVNKIDRTDNHLIHDVVLVTKLSNNQRTSFLNLHGNVGLGDLKAYEILPTFAAFSSLNPMSTVSDCYVLTERGFDLLKIMKIAEEVDLPVWSLKNNQFSELAYLVSELLGTGVISKYPNLDYTENNIDKAYSYYDKIVTNKTKIHNCNECCRWGTLVESEPSSANHNEGAIHFKVICKNKECEDSKCNLWDITPWEAVNRYQKGKY